MGARHAEDPRRDTHTPHPLLLDRTRPRPRNWQGAGACWIPPPPGCCSAPREAGAIRRRATHPWRPHPSRRPRPSRRPPTFAGGRPPWRRVHGGARPRVAAMGGWAAAALVGVDTPTGGGEGAPRRPPPLRHLPDAAPLHHLSDAAPPRPPRKQGRRRQRRDAAAAARRRSAVRATKCSRGYVRTARVQARGSRHSGRADGTRQPHDAVGTDAVSSQSR